MNLSRLSVRWGHANVATAHQGTAKFPDCAHNKRRGTRYEWQGHKMWDCPRGLDGDGKTEDVKNMCFTQSKTTRRCLFAKGRAGHSLTAHLRQVVPGRYARNAAWMVFSRDLQTPSSLKPANVRLPVPKRRTSPNIRPNEQPRISFFEVQYLWGFFGVEARIDVCLGVKETLGERLKTPKLSRWRMNLET